MTVRMSERDYYQSFEVLSSLLYVNNNNTHCIALKTLTNKRPLLQNKFQDSDSQKDDIGNGFGQKVLVLEVLPEPSELDSSQRGLYIYSVTGRQLDTFVTLQVNNQCINVYTLIDLECTDSCIDSEFVANNRILTYCFKQTVLVFNTDRTNNDEGLFKEFVEVELSLKKHTKTI